jgi:UDP-N-acetylmuramate dehydrogenase
MIFHEYFPLTRRNTFGLPSCARFFAAPTTEAELRYLLTSVTARNLPLLVLGDGSNVILAGDLAGMTLQPAMRGIHCLTETRDHYLVEAAAGERWHDFVQYTLAQNWYGLENLSLIPGTVGAAPVQNIGAYGVEITDRLLSLTAMEIATGRLREFSHAQCHFAYRDSVFKQELRGQYVIVRVRFRLLKRPALKTDYGDIQKELAQAGIESPTPRQVSAAVIALRQRKLPSPDVLGNAGSFFKNPQVTVADFERLRAAFPDLVAYPQGAYVKLAAAWLIERAGWKGRSIGPVGSYAHQALVLVNHGGATAADVLRVAQAIQLDVRQQFGITLEIEPQVYGG